MASYGGPSVCVLSSFFEFDMADFHETLPGKFWFSAIYIHKETGLHKTVNGLFYVPHESFHVIKIGTIIRNKLYFIWEYEYIYDTKI